MLKRKNNTKIFMLIFFNYTDFGDWSSNNGTRLSVYRKYCSSYRDKVESIDLVLYIQVLKRLVYLELVLLRFISFPY